MDKKAALADICCGHWMLHGRVDPPPIWIQSPEMPSRVSCRLMAGRLLLSGLERLLTPPSDILGHFEEVDKGLKEREDNLIRCDDQRGSNIGWGNP